MRDVQALMHESFPSMSLRPSRLGRLSDRQTAVVRVVGPVILVLVIGVPAGRRLQGLAVRHRRNCRRFGLRARRAWAEVLTYKTSGIFNLAIGAQAAASAYVFYSFRITLGMPWPVAALLCLLGVGLGGALIFERLAYWLASSAPVLRIVTAIGLMVFLQSLLTAAYGSATLTLPQFLPTSIVRIAGVNVSYGQIIIVAIGIVATAALYVFFRRARLGVAMQAVVQDSSLLALQATNPTVVRRYAWAIGSCFVSISGILVAPSIGVDVNHMLLVFIAAFGAAALASFTSLAGAFAFGAGHRHCDERRLRQAGDVVEHRRIKLLHADPVPGARTRARRSRRSGRSCRNRSADGSPLQARAHLPPPGGHRNVGGPARRSHRHPAPGGISRRRRPIREAAGFFIILASMGLLLWTSGQISLCQMAFAAVGAVTVGHAESAGLPWLVGVGLAILVALPVGALVAIPSFRLSGTFLAVITFGMGLLFQNLLYTTFLMFGALGGINVQSGRTAARSSARISTATTATTTSHSPSRSLPVWLS